MNLYEFFDVPEIQTLKRDYPNLIFSCIWFKIYLIPHGDLSFSELVVWNSRRLSAYRDKKFRKRKYWIKLKRSHRHIKGSRRTDN